MTPIKSAWFKIVIIYAQTVKVVLNPERQTVWPWSSLVEGDEGFIIPSGKLLSFWTHQIKLFSTCIATFQTWLALRADLVVHLILLKSFMVWRQCQCDQLLKLNEAKIFPRVAQNVETQVLKLLPKMFFQRAQKSPHIWITLVIIICHQKIWKIAQSGHTVWRPSLHCLALTREQKLSYPGQSYHSSWSFN